MDGSKILSRHKSHSELCIAECSFLSWYSVGTALTIESLDDNRLMLCRLVHGNTTTTLANVYLPCDNGSNIDEFSFYLSKIDSVLTCDVQAAAIGDFNSNITSSHHRFGLELKPFCASENLTISDSLLCKEDSYTFFSEAHNSVAWLDHVVSTSSFHSNIDDMWIDNSYVTSDHFPLFIVYNIPHDILKSTPVTGKQRCTIRQPYWSKLSDHDRASYLAFTSEALSGINLNHSLLLCDDAMCCEADHIAAIDTLYYSNC